MSRDRFRGMDKQMREEFWLNLCAKFQTYPGSRAEFLKEHDVSSSAFDRWYKKFNEQRKSILQKAPANNKQSNSFAEILAVDNVINEAVDVIDDSHLSDNEYDSLDKRINELGTHDNPIMASLELVLPDGFKVRLANHADVAMAIRLVQGIIQHD